MLLEVSKVAEVPASPASAWALIRDVARLSGCIPNVADLTAVEPDKRYTATVSDKLGPFKLTVPVQIELLEINEPTSIAAELTGNDKFGQARVKGRLDAAVSPASSGSSLAFNMRMEILGKLAALGAAPMRRRADDIFNEFVRRVQAELSGSPAPAGGKP